MRGQEEFIPTPSWSLGLELWSCHVLLFPVFFLLFITHSFHLGLHVSLFYSIYKMIPFEEWCLCLEYQQQHGWFVLGALVGRQMDRTTCRHGSNPFIQRGRFVPIRRWDYSHQELNACPQTSHSSRASDNLWQCWKLSRQQLRCSRWRHEWLVQFSVVYCHCVLEWDTKVQGVLEAASLVFLPMTQSSSAPAWMWRWF